MTGAVMVQPSAYALAMPHRFSAFGARPTPAFAGSDGLVERKARLELASRAWKAPIVPDASAIRRRVEDLTSVAIITTSTPRRRMDGSSGQSPTSTIRFAAASLEQTEQGTFTMPSVPDKELAELAELATDLIARMEDAAEKINAEGPGAGVKTPVAYARTFAYLASIAAGLSHAILAVED